ncbi:MAG: glucose-1-phosphate thymidylyltransferase RfbA [Candidatus Dojkabacteria bacterium]|nr:glucose-1-phosphate thymidylyltransferase RfbA [Candidatus Dojkabacteria bacterium]
MKGIILAAGSGTRLYPITFAISKQLMPIYDKPMIYYPLSVLIKMGIREVLIITNPEYEQLFYNLLGNGCHLGMNFSYKVQEKANGIAEAFIIGEDFIGDDSVTLILGDNIFYGSTFETNLYKEPTINGGLIFGIQVDDPERYGVVEFDENMNVLSIEEKPKEPKSKYAIPGLYIFDNRCTDFAKSIKPSARGELEITDIHNKYLEINQLKVQVLDKGTVWFDTGTVDSMIDAIEFIQVIERRMGIKIGCIEEEAYKQGFIDTVQLRKLAEKQMKSGYGKYLLDLIN